MTAKSYLYSTMKEDEEKEDRQHGGSGGIYNRQHGGSGGKFDDNRTFLQKWADSFFQKNGITADDRAKLLAKSPSMKGKDKYQEVIDEVGEALDTSTPQYGNTAKPIVYSDWSPAAQQFGMDQSTAYAEHMANTAHQREVADLRAAGLNPVLGISGSGAGSVAGSAVHTGASSAQKNLDLNGLFDFLGATAGLLVSLKMKNPYKGMVVGQSVSKTGDKFGDFFK